MDVFLDVPTLETNPNCVRFMISPQKTKKKPDLLSIESWMVNDGILIMVYYNPYITG